MNDTLSPSAEVDLDAVAWNVGVIRRRLLPGVRLLAVVKANAYGHGAVEVARTCLRFGAESLGVARLEEGIALRDAGIRAPVLIFGPVPPDGARDLQRHRLAATISGAAAATLLDARLAGRCRLPVHLKVDTGMGRLGCIAQPGTDGNVPSERARSVAAEAAAIAALPRLRLQGVYTHLACADEPDPTPTEAQLRAFEDVLREMSCLNVRPPWRHAANSAAIFGHPETHLNMVRAGLAIYGYGGPREAGLRPAMTLKTHVVQLRRLPAGATVGYGMAYRTSAPSTIATVALGYGDGYCRRHADGGQMLVRGRRAPIVGRVCMDLTMLDVSHLPDVAEGDDVVAFGCQGSANLPADEVARSIDTIPYEVTASLTSRVRRVYLHAEEPQA